MSEELLGTYQGAPRRLGRTVHRGPLPDFSARLLKELRRQGWRHAPAVIARNDDGAILSYIDGMAATTRMLRNSAAEDDCLSGVARLVREFHDLTAGSELAGDREVVCHNALEPVNTIYRRIGVTLAPVALVDWGLAAPGDRIDDVALICWRFTGLGRSAGAEMVRRRIGVVLEAYGRQSHQQEVVQAMLSSQDRALSVIGARAGAGEDKFKGLRDAGALESIRRDRSWTEQNLVD
jgi:hypothetical protein